jgi:hypothetical protein
MREIGVDLQAENAALRDDTGALRLEISGLRMTIARRDKRIEQLEVVLAGIQHAWHQYACGDWKISDVGDAILAAQPPEGTR